MERWLQVLPKHLFQVMIADGPPDRIERTDALNRNVESFRATYPASQYRCYFSEELVDFIFDHFGEPILQVYRALIPYAFKADLARYCLLFAHGGLYSDLAYLHSRSIDIEDVWKMVVFRDIAGHPSWATSNAIIYSEAKNPVMERAIHRVAEHCRTGFYGQHPLDPTGPYMFGRILAETPDWNSILFGDSPLLNIDQTGRPNILKVMPTGEVVAIRNKTLNGRITDLIASGGNDYRQLWEERRIWEHPRPSTSMGKLRARLPWRTQGD